MGRVLRNKVKNNEAVPKKHFNLRSYKKRQSKIISSNNVIKKNLKPKPIILNKPKTNLSSAIEVIQIEDNSILTDKLENINTNSSSETVSNVINDTIISISDSIDDEEHNFQILPSKIIDTNIKHVDIIDITDTPINDDDKSSISKSSDDDVQFISSSYVNDKPIDIITLSDSDEENTQCLQKPIALKSIKEHLGVTSAHSMKILKRSYNSPLRNQKKKLKNENIFKPSLFGPFIIDTERISHQSQNFKNYKVKNDTFSQQQKPSYIPNKTVSITNRRLRPILIDGLNIGHAHGCGTFSVKGIDLCVKYFANLGHKDIIAFIPQHRQGPPGSELNVTLNALFKKGHICYTPSRKVQNLRMTCYDDRIILNYAHQSGGVVVSNDNYRDLYEENENFKEIIENRQVMVTFVRDEIIVPDDQYNRKSNVRSLSDILCFPA